MKCRKILYCLILRRDVSAARQVYNEMSEQARKAPLTGYLLYKLAVLEHDRTLGESPDLERGYNTS